jgi:hypothetical protein
MSTAAASDQSGQRRDTPATMQIVPNGEHNIQEGSISRDRAVSDSYDTAALLAGNPPYSPGFGSDFDFDFSNLHHSQHDPEFYAQFFTDLALST